MKDKILIEIPEDELQGCHNCKWHEDRAFRCLLGAGIECEWEPRDTEICEKENTP